MCSQTTSSSDPAPFNFPSAVDPWITQSLVKGVLNNDLTPLEQAVAKALSYKIDQMNDWGIVDANTFLLFASGMLTWVPTETCSGKEIYNTLCMLSVVLDQAPLNGAQYTTPILPSSAGQKLAPLSQWLVDFSTRIGSWMQTSSSITADSIETFENSPLYNIDEADKPQGGWPTFNAMFSRTLLPGMRPISAGDPSDKNYDRVPIYPSDSTFDGAWPVDQNDVVTIKNLPWNISDLLQGSQYADQFKGGIWMHSFLNAFDYHRQHAPVAGKVVEAKTIPGLNYLNVLVVPDPNDPTKNVLRPRKSIVPKQAGVDPSKGVAGTLNAPDDAGYEFLQSRGCIIIENDFLGYVAVLPIGMAQVSSVQLTVSVNDTVKKGDNISTFLFGGSDLVLVFQEKAKLQILGAQGVAANGDPTSKQKYLMGMPLGYSMKGLI